MVTTKKQYGFIKVSRVDLDTASPILASSIIIQSTIQATGQEIGATYDFSSEPTGEDAGKHFNHDWEDF